MTHSDTVLEEGSLKLAVGHVRSTHPPHTSDHARGDLPLADALAT